MKTVKVVAAVICDSMDEKKQIFATARGCGEFRLYNFYLPPQKLYNLLK
ncbi:MAG: hypothetical protein U0M21_01175 [Emergencia sp.]|nr:hypothetical protein [Emergencia sp.]